MFDADYGAMSLESDLVYQDIDNIEYGEVIEDFQEESNIEFE